MNEIWILNHYAIPPELGPLTRHYKFAENLIKRGYNIKIFASSALHYYNQNMINDSSKYLYKEYNNVPFIFIRSINYYKSGKKRVINMIQYAYRLLNVSKQFDGNKPDVIFASSAHPLTWIVGYILSKRYNAKFIAETRDLWPETFVAMGKLKKKNILAKMLYKLQYFVYKKADKLVFTFPGGKDYIKELGIDDSKVTYINNGIDLKEFKYNKNNHIFKDKDLEDNNYFKIIYTGSIGIANELSYLIKAAEKVEEKGIKDIKFIIYGDGNLKEELENYVKNNNINNIIFKGRVEKKYIPYILSNSNLNIFTGKHISIYKYGLSLNKLFDYFASGRPILSNLESGYDLLEEYDCGITVKGGNIDSLVEGIFKFYNMDEEEYNKYSKNALKASEDFDFKKLTDKLEQIILN